MEDEPEVTKALRSAVLRARDETRTAFVEAIPLLTDAEVHEITDLLRMTLIAMDETRPALIAAVPLLTDAEVHAIIDLLRMTRGDLSD